MSDWLPDSPIVSRNYCPECEPGADPIQEILEVRYCGTHEPSRGGIDDSGIICESYMSGSGEAGGDDNRRWCDILHGRQT